MKHNVKTTFPNLAAKIQ